MSESPLLALLRDLPDETLRAIAERARNDHEPQYTLPWNRLSALTQHEHTALVNDVLHAAASVLADTPAFREATISMCAGIGHEGVPATTTGIYDDGNERATPSYCAECTVVMVEGGEYKVTKTVAPLPDPSGLPDVPAAFDSVKYVVDSLATAPFARFVLALDFYETVNLLDALLQGKATMNTGDWYEQVKARIMGSIMNDLFGSFHPQPEWSKVAEALAAKSNRAMSAHGTASPTKSTPQAGEREARPAEPPSSAVAATSGHLDAMDVPSWPCGRVHASTTPHHTNAECPLASSPTPAEPPSLPASEAQIREIIAHFRDEEARIRREFEYYRKRNFTSGETHHARDAANCARWALTLEKMLPASSAPGAVQQDGEVSDEDRLTAAQRRGLEDDGHGVDGPPGCSLCEMLRAHQKERRSAARPSSAAGSPGDA